LALLLGGGFLISQNQVETAQATPTTWLQVFTDDFNRADNQNVGNGWVDGMENSAPRRWKIDNNELVVSSGTDSNLSMNSLSYPSISLLNSKLEVEIVNYDKIGTYYFRLRTQNSNTYYQVEIGPTSDGQMVVRKYVNGSQTALGSKASLGIVNTTPSKMKISFEVVSTTASQTTLTATLWDITGEVETQLGMVSKTDSEEVLQNAGYLQMKSTAANERLDNLRLFTDEIDDQILANSTVEIGKPVSIRVQSTDTSAFNWFDNGAGGTFSANSSVSGINITYTPAALGDIDLTATSENGLMLEANLFVSPYSTTIGFLGDSITNEINYVTKGTTMAMVLGSGYTTVVQGVGGSKSVDWATDNFSGGTPILTNAINAFQSGNVEIVNIMLGTNDSGGTPIANYKANIQTIVDSLKTVGIRQVILNCPIYSTSHLLSNDLILGYCGALQELADENGGFALMGDSAAYDWFENNTSALPDGTHPNEDGMVQLEEFWAAAIHDNLESQINPSHEWLADDNSYTLGDAGTLTHSIDKYFGEFVDVAVDDVTLTDGDDYTATAGSTVIELTNAFLNTLAAGNHTLMVSFYGGVNVNSQFTIAAAATNPTNPTNPANPGGPSNPSVPNTGVGVMREAGVMITGLATVIVTIGIVLIGRRQLIKRD
jgi:hypothetical protein